MPRLIRKTPLQDIALRAMCLRARERNCGRSERTALTRGALSAIIDAMRPWQIAELALLLVPGLLLLCRVRRCRQWERRRVPPFTVIVPARDEESSLPFLLASLKQQSVKPAEIIVVDDRSLDATAEIAAQAGCRVLPAGRRPRGWLGKPWACWVGARAAAHELLLFLDADTRLERDGCGRILAERAARGGVVTVQPWHEASGAVEKLSSLFNIVAMAAMNTFTVFGEILPPAGCFGPCILCAKTDYFRAGGHRAVRGSVLEDVEMGRRFLAAGIAVHCFGGSRAIRIRMYPGGMAQQVEGWSKNMARGAAGSHPAVLAGISLWFTGLFSGAFFLARCGARGASLAAAEAGVFYLLYCAELL
ncbi:MAG TPA: glycosyltransferase, partial [Spirochaetia bacterium]|nr:glycosyltransferase [Spirochaetia bacterium]